MSDVGPTQPLPPAGWYPDGVNGQRYWDGSAWTTNVAPAAAPVVQKKQTNHLFHLIMTLLTFGLWIPVWIIVSIANS